ncbi:MAG: hypothetical protein DHS20C18_47150 [Saprospiraceae bacterium]|nr:MAG: hypothetical protein DHS20C18_47150 [Saprospiraceae bacterium]
MKYLKITLLFFLIGTLSACFFAPPDPSSGSEVRNWPDRRSLFRELEKVGQLLIVYPASSAELYQEMVDSLQVSDRRRFKILAKADTEVSPEELANNPIALVGALGSNQVYTQIAQQLPIQINDQGFRFWDKQFSERSATVKLFPYPSPFNREMPLLLIAGNEDQAIIDLAKNRNKGDWSAFFWSSWGFEIAEKGENRLIGYFDDKWKIDTKLSHDFTLISDTIVETKYFQFIFHQIPLTEARLDTLITHCEQTIDSLLHFLNASSLPKKIEYHLYASQETKGLQLFNTQPAHTDDRNGRVYAVFDPISCGEQLNRENKLVIQQILGKSATSSIETGLAVLFAPKWHKKGADYWGRLLYQSDNLPGLDELVDNERFKIASPLVSEAAASILVRFLLEHWGKPMFFENFNNWKPSTEEIAALNPAWEAFLSNSMSRPIKRNLKKSIPYLRGFNFAHEGYRIHNGYGSEEARNSLVSLERLGSNAIALVPYSYMSSAEVPVPLPLMHRAGSETDESVVASHAHAKALGMYTMLKPQIWMRGSWPGAIEMPDEEKWNQFFDYYYRWIRHYALLAEMEQMDMLCIGVEFSKATRQRPEDWRRIIHKLRGIYSGPMTYAANWGEEFEQLSFWDELDFIGLNCYYPLSSDKEATQDELEAGFAEVIEKVDAICKQYNKPLIFTEIGFRSVDQCWINPHADAEGRPYNEEAQRQCYEIVFQQIKDKPWCNGILWWKWPSYLEYRGEKNTGFTPNNKAAEGVVKDYFGRAQ